MNSELTRKLMPFLIPLIVLQLGLAIFSIIRIIKQPSFKYGNRLIWILLSLFLNFVGPILYFTIGKEEKR